MKTDPQRIASWVQPELFLLDVEARDRRHVLESAGRAFGRAHGLDWEPILNALWRREQAVSTALGGGFAIPHARTPGLGEPVTAFVRTASPLPFDAPDGKPVNELLVILAPSDGDKDDHLRLLALVVSLFADEAFRSELRGAATATAADAAFRSGIARTLQRNEARRAGK